MNLTNTIARQVRILKELEAELILMECESNVILDDIEFLRTSIEYLKISFGHVDVDEALELQMDANDIIGQRKKWILNQMSDFLSTGEINVSITHHLESNDS